MTLLFFFLDPFLLLLMDLNLYRPSALFHLLDLHLDLLTFSLFFFDKDLGHLGLVAVWVETVTLDDLFGTTIDDALAHIEIHAQIPYFIL